MCRDRNEWLPAGTFETIARDETGGPARAGRLWTRHGPIDTPCFMPVGTYGAVKGLEPRDLVEVGSQIILGNAYHLSHRPGAERVAGFGGLHEFIAWPRAILTDSGGFQVFSLRGLQKIDNDGVDYRTHFDGSAHRMTPRSVLEVQAGLGSDICMVLDHCPPGDASRAQIRDAMDRSTRWARIASDLRRDILAPGQLCFGIVQGGTDLELRREHVAALREFDFDGLALGGLSVGEPIPEMHATMAAIAPIMPPERPRYVMGIGTPADLLAAVSAGVDMFDCVMPTRHARNGQLFTWQGRMNIRQSRYRDDASPLDERCVCRTCAQFSRAYLRHLHESKDPLYGRLATIHNLFFFHQWVATLRHALREARFGPRSRELSQVISQHYPPTGPVEGS
ncbi:MAG: tRNA guanosine(34) transglycosylase Tgt [Myxococcales bacterium]|nr:tRNA guanosine(34) transglycosylase Tgt [Myxococcales bacterium]MCB9752764.1 tRNA guanosine(34) transglycosylase Tgt [Myxococcales bacterium]